MFIALLGSNAQAVNRTWDGNGGDDNWNTGANWGGTAPSATGDTLFFGGTTRLVNTNNVVTSLNGITFNSGAGAFELWGNAITLAGGITNNESVNLQTIHLNLALSATRTISVVSGGTVLIDGVISGSGITKIGAGTVTLSGGSANTYSGLTTVNAGTLRLSKTAGVNAIGVSGLTIGDGSGVDTVQLTAANQIADAAAITISSSGVLDLNDNAETIGSLAGSSGASVTLGSATLTLSATASSSYAGTISGTGGLIKQGTGILTLTGANSYTGKTTINAGMISISAENNLGANPGSFTADQLTLNGGILYTTSSFSIDDANRGITLGASGGTFTNAATTLTIANVITGLGGLTKTGSGTNVLTAANTYSGTTTINAGRLQISSANDRLPTGTAVSFANTAGAILDLNDLNQTIGSLTGGGAAGGNILLGSGTLTVSGSASPAAYAGVISGIGALVKQGSGTLTLSGANTYSGSTTISAGVLNIRVANALGGTGTGTTVGSGAALQLQPGSGVTFAAEPLTLNGTGVSSDGALRNIANANTYAGAITLGSSSRINSDANTLTLSGGITGAGNALTIGGAGTGVTVSSIITGSGTVLTWDGAGLLTLSGNNSFSGGLTFSSGSIAFNHNSAAGSGTITVGSGAVEFLSSSGTIVLANDISLNSGAAPAIYSTGSLEQTGVISGLGGLVRNNTGAGTLILSGANTFSGGFKIVGRGLTLNNKAALGTGTFTIGDTVTAPAAAIQLQAGSVLTGANAIANAIAVNRDFTLAGANAMEFSGAVTLAVTPTITVSATANQTFSDVISGAFGLTKAGTGALILSGVNTYTGITTLTAGTLSISAEENLSGNPGVFTADQLTLNGGTLQTTASFSIDDSNRGVTLGASGGTFNVNSATTLTVANVIAGTGSLTKATGTGTLILNAANTYTGPTTNSAGTLSINSIGNVSGGATALGNPTTAANGTIRIGSGATSATLLYTGSGHTSDRVIDLAGTTGGAALNASGSGALTLTSDLTATGAGAKTLTLTGTSTDANTISGKIVNYSINNTTAVTKSGVGTWILSGDNAYTGATTLSSGGGTLRATTSANALGLGNLTLAGGILELANDTGLAFNRNTTVSGATTIKSDRLSSGTGVTHTLGTLSINGSTLSVTAGANVSANSDYGLTFGDTTLSAGTATFDVANNGTGIGTLTLGRLVGNGNNFAKQGSGTLVLGTDSVRISGAATLTAGTLKLGSTNALGRAAATLTLNGGTLVLATDTSVTGYNTTVGGDTTIVSDRATGGEGITHTLGELSIGAQTLTVDRGANATGTAGLAFGVVTLTGNAVFNPSANTLLTLTSVSGDGQSFTVQGAGNTTISDVIGTTTGGLTKNGAGTLTLSGTTDNTYSGATTVTSGELDLNKSPNTAAIAGDVIINGGTLKLLADGQIKNTSAVTMSSGTFDLNGKTEIVASFQNSGGTFTTGAGLLIIASGSTVTWSGGNSTINNGGLVQDAHIVITGGNNTVEGGATGGVLQLNGGGTGLEMTGGTLTLNSDNAVAGKLVLNGDVTTFASGTTSFISSGLALANAGTIDLNGATNTFTIANGAATDDMSISAIISNGGLTKAGDGTLTLSGTNTYAGTTTISAGKVKAQSNTALGDTTGATIVVSGAAIQIDGDGLVIGENITLSGDGGGAGALENLFGLNTGSGTIGFDSAARINSTAGTLMLSGATISGNGYAMTYGGAGNITISSIINGMGSSLTYDGSGLLTLSGANTYDGTTTVKSGTLVVAADALSGSAGALGKTTSAVLVGDGGGSLNASLLAGGAFTIGRAMTVQSGSTGTATLGGNTAAVSTFSGGIVLNKDAILTAASGGEAIFTGVISGGSGITKSGAGTVTLSGANTYTGGTTLSQGTLKLGAANVLPSSGTFNFAGGLLDANNQTDGTIGALSLTANSTLLFHAGSGAGSLTFTSAAWTAGTLTITGWSGVARTPGTDDMLFVTFGLASQDFLDNIYWSAQDITGAIQLGSGEIVPVPEPINVALGIFAGVFVAFGIGRRLYARRRA